MEISGRISDGSNCSGKRGSMSLQHVPKENPEDSDDFEDSGDSEDIENPREYLKSDSGLKLGDFLLEKNKHGYIDPFVKSLVDSEKFEQFEELLNHFYEMDSIHKIPELALLFLQNHDEYQIDPLFKSLSQEDLAKLGELYKILFQVEVL